MLGKLFGLRKDKKATPPAPPVTPPPKPDKQREPSLLEQLTGGQPIDSIADTDLLHQLVKHSDKLDKKANRQVRERLAALKEQEKQRQAQLEQQQRLCGKLETLARLQHHPLFDSELAHLQQQWQTIAAHDAAIASKVLAAIDQCQAIQQEALDRRAAEQAAARAAEEQRQAQLQRAAERAAAEQEQSAAQQHAVQQQQEKQQHSQADRAKHAQRQQEIRQTLQQQLQQLEHSIEQADSKKARDLLDKARDNLKKLDSKQQHEFDGKLHLLAGQLRDLQDWQAFAALPKLEELCATMEKLVDIDLPPLQKADSVRELQQQWRAMKPPTGKQSQKLWDRFKQASDKAWEPCAAHFEKERQHRAFNLQQRQAICDALEQFFAAQNWDKADWKAVARILDKAKQEYHDFHPVERNEEKGIRARFDAAVVPIQQKLLEEQQRNEEKKRQLVEAAKSVATMADLDKAAERVRQLQEQWKTVGLTRRSEDQKLWEAFQQHTGAIFGRRRDNQQQQRQAEQEQSDLARQCCERISALASLPDVELTQSGAAFDQLQAEFKALTATLHEKQQQPLKKAFHGACDRYRQQVAGISQRQQAAQLAELARRAELCVALETGSLDADAVAAQWQQLSLPAEWERAIAQRLERATRPQDYAANEILLRELCIALEVLLDLDTPDEDRAMRRDYQMRRLQQGLGQGASEPREQLLQRVVQWHCASPASAAVQAALQQRFEAAQQAAGNMLP